MNQHQSPSDDSQFSDSQKEIKQSVEDSVINGGIQGIIGDNNTQIQDNRHYNIWKFVFDRPIEPSVVNSSRPKNEKLLLSYVKTEVTSRLSQSLHNQVLINLSKQRQPGQVRRPWDIEVKIGLKFDEILPEHTSILDVFDQEETDGKLLILGQPGSGKTTTLLELARNLIERAENQPEYPIPVMFNLSSWKDNRKLITDWLVEELRLKYRVRKDIGRFWIRERKLLPLLDGLDEVKTELQESCVKAINQWMQGIERPLYLVACSRLEEYESYNPTLELNCAILLKPLTDEQIRQYLKDINSEKLYSELQRDIQVFRLLHTPLWLNILLLSYSEFYLGKNQKSLHASNYSKLLLDSYIKLTLEGRETRIALKWKKIPSIEEIHYWLKVLAWQLQRESISDFLIETMQPNWLLSKRQKAIYRLTFLILFALISNTIPFFLYSIEAGVYFLRGEPFCTSLLTCTIFPFFIYVGSLPLTLIYIFMVYFVI